MELNITPNILVIGGGLSALLSAHRLSKEKLPVWIIDQGEGFKVDLCFKEYEKYFQEALEEARLKGVIFLENTKIKRLEGTSGNFKVLLDVDGKQSKENFGAIVVATPYRFNPVFSEYELEPSEAVLSLRELEEKLENFKDLNHKTFVFLTRFEDESDPVSFKRIIRGALSLKGLNARVYVVVKNVKVAAPGMEKLVVQAKEKGILIIKTEKKPAVSHEDGLKVQVVDSIIKEKISIVADFIVVEDEILPNSTNQELAEILKIHPDACGFLQSNNVRRVPVYTNRKGIFVVGTASSIKPFYYVLMDSLSLIPEIKSYLKELKGEVQEKVVIDHDRCVCCLTCYRVCPHGAIIWEYNRVVVSALACEGCGTCAAECPMNAIQIKEYSDDSIKSQIADALTNTSVSPVIVGFCCENSAYEALAGAKKLGYQLPDGLIPIKVPCAGKIDVDYVFDALAKGADGVLIGACYNGNCKSEKGTLFARYRTEEIKKFLKDAGLNPDRVCVVNVASNMAKEFSLKAMEMKEKLNNS